MQTPCAGSSLDELLADDLIQAMMDADKVNPAFVRSLFHSVAPRGGSRAGHLQGDDPQPCCHPKM